MTPIENVGAISGTSEGKQGIDISDERKAFDNIPETKDTEEAPDEGETKDTEESPDDESQDGEDSTEESRDSKETEDEEETEEVDDETEEDDEELAADSLYQELKKRNPKLLKEMPELRRVLFREKQYTEVFPSLDEAKEAKDRAETFGQFERDIMSGDSTNLLAALESSGKKTLEGFVANLFPTLEKTSKELYLGAMYPEFKKMLRAAVASGDERLVQSAKNLNWFIFNNTNVESDAGLKPTKKDERDEELSQRERDITQRQYNSFNDDVSEVATKRLTHIISAPFQDSGLSELMIKKLTEEIFSRVDKEVVKDSRHMGNMKNLWKQAALKGFTSNGKDSIISAYLSRAKLLVPRMRQQVLAEAKVQAKLGTGVTKKKEPKRITSSSMSMSRGPGKVDGKKIDWNKTDERAMLDGRFVTKG